MGLLIINYTDALFTCHPTSEVIRKRELLLSILQIDAGLLEEDSSWDFLEVTLLACFCAIHNHGFEMLFSFSAIVQHAPSPPIGFSILKAGLSKSVLMSVYSSSSVRQSPDSLSYGKFFGESYATYFYGYLCFDFW